MDKPRRRCPRCAAVLEAAPLTFTLAYVCPRSTCGLVFARAQDANRVIEELAALRSGAPHAPAPPFQLSGTVLELPRKAA